MSKMRYNKKLGCLINPTEEEVFSREPLLKFSFALNTRHNHLTSVADEILNILDNEINENKLCMSRIEKAGILIWLWTLGAYEIVRTMCQASSCFSKPCLEKLNSLKRKLAQVRIPDTKMEKAGKKDVPINSNRSPWCEDIPNKDLLVGAPENPFSARNLLDEYFSTIDSIEMKDILNHHESSYKR